MCVGHQCGTAHDPYVSCRVHLSSMRVSMLMVSLFELLFVLEGGGNKCSYSLGEGSGPIRLVEAK